MASECVSVNFFISNVLLIWSISFQHSHLALSRNSWKLAYVCWKQNIHRMMFCAAIACDEHVLWCSKLITCRTSEQFSGKEMIGWMSSRILDQTWRSVFVTMRTVAIGESCTGDDTCSIVIERKGNVCTSNTLCSFLYGDGPWSHLGLTMTCESSSTNVLELGELFITVVRPCFRMRPIVEKKTHLILRHRHLQRL